MLALLNFTILAGIIAAPLLLYLYVFPLLRRDLDGRPKITWALVLLSLVLLLTAAATFGHFFPNCSVGIGLGITYCRP